MRTGLTEARVQVMIFFLKFDFENWFDAVLLIVFDLVHNKYLVNFTLKLLLDFYVWSIKKNFSTE